MTTDTIAAATPRIPGRILGLFRRHPEAFAALLIVVICIAVGTINPAFWQLANLFDILRASVVRGLFALGVLMVLSLIHI